MKKITISEVFEKRHGVNHRQLSVYLPDGSTREVSDEELGPVLMSYAKAGKLEIDYITRTNSGLSFPVVDEVKRF